MSNRVRHYMKEEVDAIIPLLHETYMRIGRFQKNRSKRNEALLHDCLDRIGPALQVFKPAIQAPKRVYFDAILIDDLEISDRIIALDTAVGAMHIEFSVPRMYMHRESEELKRALDECRMSGETPSVITEDPVVDRAICRGLPAAPGIASGEVFRWDSGDPCAGIPRGCILVARMTRPDISVCMDRISGIVTDIGGRLSHAAILALERNVPCVVGTKVATRLLSNGMKVSVDGNSGAIFPA